ncbi:MAPEG family protein [Sphingosinithalassobacter portus]|uniref:MAPEG family protein n=1 Tax=Stakelama portus TaxID=2676234 RepID=UPI000D6E1301|nr:MAPEG family protein [Sphingosinithalassobacter portus]
MVLPILWPSFALVALIFVVWLTMFVQRGAHIRRNPPAPATFESSESALRYFQPVEMAANNLRNLTEMPLLYFALVPLLLITHHAGHVQVVLAWVYVILRIIHSFVHIVPKHVPTRAMVYLASCAVLMAMWIGFAIDMATAGAMLR